MGQYWEWLCPDKKERLCTHELSYGLKWWEQVHAGGIHTALMLLKTDVSSLGHGGGDLVLQELPTALQPLVTAVLGSWTGHNIEFTGDYSNKLKIDDSWSDISPQVAAAVFAIEHESWYNEDQNATDNIAALKQKLCTHPVFQYTPVDSHKFFDIIKAALDKKKMNQEGSTSNGTKRAASSSASSLDAVVNIGKDRKPDAGKDKKSASSTSGVSYKRPRGAAPKVNPKGDNYTWDKATGMWRFGNLSRKSANLPELENAAES